MVTSGWLLCVAGLLLWKCFEACSFSGLVCLVSVDCGRGFWVYWCVAVVCVGSVVVSIHGLFDVA